MAVEKNFENRVKKYLDEYGCWWLKYWGGAAYTKSGIPDLLVSSDGCFLGIEVKQFKGFHLGSNLDFSFNTSTKFIIRFLIFD